jgi:hypothetical protein
VERALCCRRLTRPTSSKLNAAIGLDSWITQDSNYLNFESQNPRSSRWRSTMHSPDLRRFSPAIAGMPIFLAVK